MVAQKHRSRFGEVCSKAGWPGAASLVTGLRDRANCASGKQKGYGRREKERAAVRFEEWTEELRTPVKRDH